ncbi:beta-xylanase [Planctomycetales bacterium]|nr:beta-xylanase [Planctomycetales bacterium]
MQHKIFTVICTFIVFAVTAAAQEPEAQKPIVLWENGAPNALGDAEKDKPKITVWFPEKPVGTAVVICPGGGYGGWDLNHEGRQMAQWFNSFGVTAALLEYRHRRNGYGHPNPLLDVQRAIRTIRFNAEKWNVKADKIGVIGFSAGGHLASSAGTHFDAAANPVDDIDKVSCRPDFMILCYPVIVFDAPFTHVGSQHNLVGKDAPQELRDYYSSEKQVTDKTPPTFLWATTADTAVPPENSIEFYLALRKHKVPAELHIYQNGRHGLGLAKGNVGTETWSDSCKLWLKNNGFAE